MKVLSADEVLLKLMSSFETWFEVCVMNGEAISMTRRVVIK